MVGSEPGTFGPLLRRLRVAAGLTQEALAARAGVSARAVGDLERHPDRLPRLDSVNLLADSLGLDPAERARFLAAARPQSEAPAAPDRPVVQSESLPRPLTPLIGRDGAVDAVDKLLRRGEDRLLTLTGPGGVGKTRLALAVAERVSSAYAAGVVFVDLAPLRTPALVLPTIAQRLALDERDATPVRERLVAFLRPKHLLLLLDNLEHLVAAGEDILALLTACSRLAVLATSRVGMRVRGEREYRVAPLELPGEADAPEDVARSPAAALFLERARAVGGEPPLGSANTPAVAAICRRLDGLPLAIELAAAWALLLPPPELLARLERRLPLLVGGSHDLPARQRTMRDAIAWSYGLLDPPEQRLFRWLAVFAGGCTVAAAEEVCAGTGDDPPVLAGLAALVDKSLLRRQDEAAAGSAEPRLAMLETLREYALERLAEHGEEEAARRQHAAYYLALAEAAEPALSGRDGEVWGARLEREHDNLRAALRWALDRGDGALGLPFTAALWRFWSARGHLGEGRRWLREALATPGAAARVQALAGAATLAIEQADYGEAAELTRRAVDLARERGSRADLIAALNARGRLEHERNEYQAATRDHEEARALALALGDRAVEAAALTGLAFAATFSGDIARGLELSAQSLATLREVGDVRALAEGLVGAGSLAHFGGDSQRADTLGAEALDLFRALGDTGRIAETLFLLGSTAHVQGRYDRAIACYEAIVALCRARGDEHGMAKPLSALGLIALQTGDFARARALLEATLTIVRQYDDRWGRAIALALLGQVELAAGDIARAEVLLDESAALHRGLGTPHSVPWCLEGLAGVAAARGEFGRVARIAGALDAIRAQLGPSFPPVHPSGYADAIAATRTALGVASFETARAAGAALSPDQVLAEALASE